MVMTCVAAGVLTWKMPSDDILLQNVASMITVPCLLCSISVSISTDVSRNQFN